MTVNLTTPAVRHFCSTLRAVLLAVLAAVAATGVLAQHEGVDVGHASPLAQLVSADEVENAASQQYRQLLQQAAAKRAVASANNSQLRRLRAVAARLIPQADRWSERASSWDWEINLIESKQINALCLPGGKIVVFTALLEQLQPSDAELAMVLAHEMAHALREHARARMGKSAVTQGASRLGGALVASIFGIDPSLTDLVARGAANLLTLKFSRSDETEADLVGMETAARAGYDPHAAISLWQKMSRANSGAPLEWLSTHPSDASRIDQLQRNLPRVAPLYEQANARR